MFRAVASSSQRTAMMQRIAASSANMTSKSSSSASQSIAWRAFSSSFSADSRPDEVQFNRVYTHPLSQIVLEHMQKVHGDWLVRKGLDRGFVLNRDGTFILHFPALYPGDDSGRIW